MNKLKHIVRIMCVDYVAGQITVVLANNIDLILSFMLVRTSYSALQGFNAPFFAKVTDKAS